MKRLLLVVIMLLAGCSSKNTVDTVTIDSYFTDEGITINPIYIVTENDNISFIIMDPSKVICSNNKVEVTGLKLEITSNDGEWMIFQHSASAFCSDEDYSYVVVPSENKNIKLTKEVLVNVSYNYDGKLIELSKVEEIKSYKK